jgi:D-alanine-D-alanine ligase-like ATP-grasp enzyme
VSVLRSAGFNVIQRFVTLSTVDSSLDSALAEAASMNKTPVIFNLCDGLESDGYPGISVPRACAARNVAFTGADMDFFANTTAKTDMKRRFLSHGVSTAVHIELNQLTQPAEIDALNSYPLLVKPSVSYASCSITDASVVYSASEALAQAARVRAEVVAGGVFAESFLNGREYTALVMSGPSLQSQPVCLPVAERVFDSSLPQHQRFLAFNRYWAGFVVAIHLFVDEFE